ncbi:MAG: hypothetical protein ACK4Q4_05495 [Rhodocyclaceae bacterium]
MAFPLRVSMEQEKSLRALQELFAEACNHLSPIVRANRCWNRVALHHLAYRQLRQRFPQLGSQMACNAIYSVCRAARIVYQHPQSPWNVTRNPAGELPLLRFLPRSPVYFDRHTLSLKGDSLSLFTLDGRMHFCLDISPEIHHRFRNGRLREISLMRDDRGYVLHFHFREDCDLMGKSGALPAAGMPGDLPEYLIVQDSRGKVSVPRAVLSNID